jgi:hypothetical protein
LEDPEAGGPLANTDNFIAGMIALCDSLSDEAAENMTIKITVPVLKLLTEEDAVILKLTTTTDIEFMKQVDAYKRMMVSRAP